MSPDLGNPDGVTLEVHLAGKPPGSAALTEDDALDLALRLVGTIMNRRRVARERTRAPRPIIYRRLEVVAGGKSP